MLNRACRQHPVLLALLVTLVELPCCAREAGVRMGASENDLAPGFTCFLAAAQDGHVFTGCQATGKVSFDSVYSCQDNQYFVVCYEPNLSVRWLQNLSVLVKPEIHLLEAGSVSDKGSLFVTGTCGGEAALASGADLDQHDVIVLRFDRDGRLVWQTAFSEPGDARPSAIAVDSSENVYVAGQVWGDSSLANEEVSRGRRLDALFLKKLAPSGEAVWEKTWPLSRRIEFRPGLAISPQDEPLLCGCFAEIQDFHLVLEEQPYVSEGQIDCFLLACNEDGAPKWASTWGGEFRDSAFSIIFDSQGNIYVTGACSGAMYLRHPARSRIRLESAGESDAFLMKFTESGEYRWMASWGGPGKQSGQSVQVGRPGDIFVQGVCEGACDFGPVRSLGQTGGATRFVARFDSNGAFQSYSSWISKGQPSFAVLPSGSVFVACDIPSEATAKEFEFGNGDISSEVRDAFLFYANPD